MTKYKNFKDINFKLAVIYELQQLGFYVKEVEALYEKYNNPGDYSQETIAKVYDYYCNLEIEEEKLDRIEKFCPDVADFVFKNLINNWDGEDDRFDIKSFEDLDKLKNIKRFNPVSMISIDSVKDVSHFLNCEKLQYVNFEYLRDVPNVSTVVEQLRIKGVKVIFENEENNYKDNIKLGEQISSDPKIEGDKFFRDKEYAKALEHYQVYVNGNSNDYWVWHDMGLCYLRLKNFEEAIKCLLRSVEIRPDYPDAYWNLAVAYDKIDNDLKAIKYYKKYLANGEGDKVMWYRFASLCSRNDLKEDALWAFEKAVFLDKKNGQLWNSFGFFYLKFGEPSLGIRCFEKAINFGFAKFGEMNLGHVFLIEGNKVESIKHYKNSFSYYDNVKDFISDYDSDFSELKKYKIAKEQYEKIREEILKI